MVGNKTIKNQIILGILIVFSINFLIYGLYFAPEKVYTFECDNGSIEKYNQSEITEDLIICYDPNVMVTRNDFLINFSLT